jgi:hypothetical protein
MSLSCFEKYNGEGKFEFGGSFGMSLVGDCHEVKDTPNLKLLVAFGMSWDGVCHELYK